jgi:hypothetical protein
MLHPSNLDWAGKGGEYFETAWDMGLSKFFWFTLLHTKY